MLWRVCTVACLLALGAAGAWADAAAERERIETERRLIEAAFADEEGACLRRFIVTPCIEAVQARRREALAPLRHQELLLDEAERRARAAARLQGIEARRAAAAERPPEAPAPLPAEPQPGTPADAASAPALPPPTRATPSQDRSAAAEAAARRAAAAQRRRDAAAADRARIAERQAQQQGQRSAPLPVPGLPAAASAAPAASAVSSAAAASAAR